jgi:heptosyltransferase III
MGAARKRTPPKITLNGKRILIIKLRYIGDTLSVIPVIETLRRHAPDTEIDVMVNKGTEEILVHQPGISRIWPYDRAYAKESLLSTIRYHSGWIRKLRARSYHAVLDFTHGDRAAFLSYATGAPHRVSYSRASSLSKLFMNHFISGDPSEMHIVDYQLMALMAFGLERFVRELRVTIPEAVLRETDSSLGALGIPTEGLNAAIHPGARGRLRQWPAERFAEVARRLHTELKARIFLIGGPLEAELVESVERLMGFPAAFKSTDLSLLSMASLFSRSHLFLGNDSAPAHLAAAAGCPTLTLFGPTFPRMWRPFSDKGEVIFKNIDCCGCRQEVCVRPGKSCMHLIEVGEVWQKLEKMASHIGH